MNKVRKIGAGAVMVYLRHSVSFQIKLQLTDHARKMLECETALSKNAGNTS